VSFFAVNSVIEFLSFVIYLAIWIRQRGKQDLVSVKNCDCKFQCALMFMRTFWTIGLSVFLLTGVIHLESGSDPYKSHSHGSIDVRNKELNVIYKVTVLTMILEGVQILVFVVCLMF